MLYRLKISIRIQLLLIVSSLLVLTSVLNVSAYLTDSQTYSSSFHVASGEDFGIHLDGEIYEDKAIFPGEKIDMHVSVTNTGTHDAYVFLVIDMPNIFNVKIDDEWKTFTTSTNQIVYYYGDDNGNVKPVSAKSKINIFETITFDSYADTENGTSCSVIVDAYAMQAEFYYSDTNASIVWQYIQ